MSNTAAKALAVWEILQQTDRENPLSAAGIIERLSADYGLEAERKSIYRLMEQLQKMKKPASSRIHHTEIRVSEGASGGFYLERHAYQDWEIKLLTDAVASARVLCPENAAALTEKLQKELGLSSRNMLEQMRLHTVPRTENKETCATIAAVLDAISRKKTLTFQYQTLSMGFQTSVRRKRKTYRFSPYCLYWQDDCYYVAGNTRGHDNLSTYRPDRMINAVITEEPARSLGELFGKNPEEKLSDHIRKNTYRYGGEEIRLRLLCQDGTENDIYDRFGLPEEIEAHAEGFTCVIPTQNSEGLIYWLMQNAGSIRVLSPGDVRDRLIQTLQRALSGYGSPQPEPEP